MRAASVVALLTQLLLLTSCNDSRGVLAARQVPASDPFDWSTLPDGTLRPPDGPCASDRDCVLRSDCGCGCFAVREDFTDPQHRCTRCAAQVPLCLGATARCDPATRHCAVSR